MMCTVRCPFLSDCVHMRTIKHPCPFITQNTNGLHLLCYSGSVPKECAFLSWTMSFFYEVDSVAMVDTENHLADSYRCHKRGPLIPAVKYKEGISHLMCLSLCQFCLLTQCYDSQYYFITRFHFKHMLDSSGWWLNKADSNTNPGWNGFSQDNHPKRKST